MICDALSQVGGRWLRRDVAEAITVARDRLTDGARPPEVAAELRRVADELDAADGRTYLFAVLHAACTPEPGPVVRGDEA